MRENKKIQNEVEEIEEWQKESITRISEKTQIEKLLVSEHYLYNEEKSKYLGKAKEDVLYAYTSEALDSPDTYKQLRKDLQDQKVGKAIINGTLISEVTLKIIEEVKKRKMPFTIVKDPQFKEEIGLELIRISSLG